MRTDCTEEQLAFQGLGRRAVVADFSAGRLSSDAGGVLLLREVAERSGLLRRFAACFTDHRDPALIEHTVAELVTQRVLALACGYEDLNDHDVLRDDALLAVAAGKADVTGAQRRRRSGIAGTRWRGRARSIGGSGRRPRRRRRRGTTRSSTTAAAIERRLRGGVPRGASRRRRPRSCSTSTRRTIRCTGARRGGSSTATTGATATCRCTSSRATSCWRRSCGRADADGAAGAVEEVARIVARLRAAWPAVRIIVRGDSGFARDALMAWCEAHGVDYVLGLGAQ